MQTTWETLLDGSLYPARTLGRVNYSLAFRTNGRITSVTYQPSSARIILATGPIMAKTVEVL